MKFQSVTGQEGFFMSFHGPVAGCQHDSFMLYESGLLRELERLLTRLILTVHGYGVVSNVHDLVLSNNLTQQ
jgi:hypothetical protein